VSNAVVVYLIRSVRVINYPGHVYSMICNVRTRLHAQKLNKLINKHFILK